MDRFGETSSALSFDGINDYVRVPNAPSLNPTQGITVAMWVNPRQQLYAPGADMLSKYYADGYYMRIAYDQIQFTSLGNNWTSISIPVNSWSHVVGTYNASNAESVVYVNGKEVSRQQVCWPAPCPIVNVPNDLVLGAFSDGMQLFYNGLLDDVFIYDRPLDAHEIGLIFN